MAVQPSAHQLNRYSFYHNFADLAVMVSMRRFRHMDNYKLKRIWKILLLITAVHIGVFSILYTNKLVRKLADEEKKKIKLWANAIKLIGSSNFDENVDIELSLSVIQDNTTIPVILTDESGNIITTNNLDTLKVKDTSWVREQLMEMVDMNPPIIIEYAKNQKQFLYYKNSVLLTQLQQYPILQMIVIALFILVSYFAFSYSRKSEQNQVWVGLAKETAHQLGTPISSLSAWLEYIRSNELRVDEETLLEMQKDIDRLGIITNRFSKIGSTPSLDSRNIVQVVEQSVDYLRNRVSSKVVFDIQCRNRDKCNGYVNVPLFDWVVENLCKNAIDAMNGDGKITFHIIPTRHKIYIDVNDTGKGIPKNKFRTIFKPGYTTKKRGWGLGLSLVKRIIENYHKGSIFVKDSLLNVGTTFRITLKRAPDAEE